jgi:hypothetical protein
VVQSWFDQRIKALGVQNAYFPMFITEDVLNTEKDHVEGFAPEVGGGWGGGGGGGRGWDGFEWVGVGWVEVGGVGMGLGGRGWRREKEGVGVARGRCCSRHEQVRGMVADVQCVLWVRGGWCEGP